MDEVIEMIGNVAEPVVDTLQDLGGDAIERIMRHNTLDMRLMR